MKSDTPLKRALRGDRTVTRDGGRAYVVTRAVALDDIVIRPRSKGGDGRTVDAYAAVFMTPAEIVDDDGHYSEQNDPKAFNRSLATRKDDVFCIYNHGKTLGGTPSDVWSVPIGTPLDIRPDSRGLFTSTRYNKDPDAERILEAIKSGSLRGMSYTGVFLRSTPELTGPFDRYTPSRTGDLTLVTRLEIALIEYGPTPIPAFKTAEVVGVRSGVPLPYNVTTAASDGTVTVTVNPVITVSSRDGAPIHHTGIHAEGDYVAGEHEGRMKFPTSWDGMTSMYALADQAAGVDGKYTADAGMLPHHVVGDNGVPGHAHLAGVRAALNSVDDHATGENSDSREKARAHLRAHLEDAKKGQAVTVVTPGPGNATNNAGSSPKIESGYGGAGSSGRDGDEGRERKKGKKKKDAQRAKYDPDHDGDDDSTPQGDTDHDYFAPDGTQLKPVPGKPLAKKPPVPGAGGGPGGMGGRADSASDDDEDDIQSRADDDAGADDDASSRGDSGSWDGPAAMSAAANSKNPASAYASICAGRKSGDPSKQSSWALPHHAHPGGPPNENGVRNALSRLPQTQGLTNKSAALAHLKAHLASFGGGDGKNSGTSSSGRHPLNGDAVTGPQAAGRADPHQHSATGSSGKGYGMEPGQMTVEERIARQSEIRARFNELDTQYMGGELPEEARSEWRQLQEELVVHDRAIQDASARRQYLETIGANGDPQGGATEGVDNGETGYGNPAPPMTPQGYAPYQPPPAGFGRHSSAPSQSRFGNGGFMRTYTAADIYDLAGIRTRARSYDEMKVLYRENAYRAIEQARFGYTGFKSREQCQETVAGLLDRIDDEQGTLSRRILTTGSPLYDRAFGKALAAMSTNGLTGEESRALALGVDTAGGYAVPFQLDPTVIITSNGAINPLRQIARVEQITGKEWDGVTSANITVTRVAEGTEAGSADPAFVQPNVRTTRVQGFIPFNIELDVSWGALRSQMTNLLMDAKDVEEATAFALGNGTAPQANGVVTTLGTASQVFTASSATLAIADLYSLENAMAPRFRQQSSYLASKTTYNRFRQLFQALASAAFDSWVRPSAGTPATFNGYPAYEQSAMANTITSGSRVLLQGDFSQFLIVDRIGMGIELIPHLFGATNRYPVGQRGILAIWFNNSQVLVPNAFRLLTTL